MSINRICGVGRLISLLLALFGGFVLIVEPVLARVSYRGYSLLNAVPQDEGQLEELKRLARGDLFTFSPIDFWLAPSSLGRDVSFMVEPSIKSDLMRYLELRNISAVETVQDVGFELESERQESFSERILNKQQSDLLDTASSDADPFLLDYQPYDKIEQKILSYRSKPNVQVKLLGYSYEQRRIYLVQVSSNPQLNKPVILIDAGHHAREWITHSTIMYLLDSITNESGAAKNNGSSLASKLDEYDFWFVPTINPDGYVYSHNQDRLWRKTRSRGAYCVGTDPNRNYNDHWNSNAQSYECSQVYAGKSVESEIEVKQMAQLLYYNRQRIAMYLSLHSYSQLILWPYGYANEAPANEHQLRQVASAGVAGIKSHRGTTYAMGRTAGILYVATGTSVDYAMAKCGIKFAYTLELPDRGQKGFVLSRQEILPVGIETELGISAMIDKMTQLIS